MRLFLSLFLLTYFSVLSQENIDKHNYKMNRKAYLLKYAQEDSVLAEAINLYFDKRASGMNKIVAFPLGVVVTTAASTLLLASEDVQTKSLASYGVLFGGVTSLIGIPLGINGIKLLKKYTRKNLYLAILQIKSGEMTSQDFYNKIYDDN